MDFFLSEPRVHSLCLFLSFSLSFPLGINSLAHNSWQNAEHVANLSNTSASNRDILYSVHVLLYLTLQNVLKVCPAPAPAISATATAGTASAPAPAISVTATSGTASAPASAISATATAGTAQAPTTPAVHTAATKSRAVYHAEVICIFVITCSRIFLSNVSEARVIWWCLHC